MLRVLYALLIAALFSVSGCGDSDSSQQERAARERESAQKERERRSAIFRECQEVVGPLDSKLTDLDSRLSVGLSFEKYGEAVASAKAAYDRIVPQAKARGGLSNPCINRVAVPLESALRAYLRSYRIWERCINDYTCSFDQGSPALKSAQAGWGRSSKLVTRADASLLKLQPR